MNLHNLDPVVSATLMKKICWRLTPLMVIMYLVSSLDRANIGYAALAMNKDMGMTVADFGMAASIFYLGFILFQTPSNLALQRFGARRWIATILLAWGVTATMTSIASDKYWLYVVRFFLGIFEAGLLPGMVLYLALWLPSRNRVWILAMLTAAMPMSAVVGAPVSTALMEHASLFGLSGWRSMLFLEGLPAILLSCFVYYYLPDSPRTAKWISSAEHAELQTALDVEASRRDPGASYGTMWSAMLNARVWALGFSYFGINAGIVILLYFLPQVIKTFEITFGVKYSIFQVGMIAAIPFGIAVCTMLTWGRFVSRRGIAAWHVACPLAVCAGAIGGALLMPNPILVLAAFAVAASACFSAMAPFWQLPIRFLSGKTAAAGVGMISSLGVSSGCVLPYIIGWTKDTTGSFSPAFLGIAAVMLAASLVVLALERSVRQVKLTTLSGQV